MSLVFERAFRMAVIRAERSLMDRDGLPCTRQGGPIGLSHSSGSGEVPGRSRASGRHYPAFRQSRPLPRADGRRQAAARRGACPLRAGSPTAPSDNGTRPADNVGLRAAPVGIAPPCTEPGQHAQVFVKLH